MDVITGRTLKLALKRMLIKPEVCKLIWRAGDDAETWRSRLVAITPDPGATSHKKKLIDPRRFNCHSIRHLEELEAQLIAGTLALRRIPMDSIDPILMPTFKCWLDEWRGYLGHKTSDVLAYGIWWLQEHVPAPATTSPLELTFRLHRRVLTSNDGRLSVYLGRPPLNPALLLAGKVEDRKVCLIPHRKKGQSNGLFEFSPGKPADIDIWLNIERRMIGRD